MKLVPRVDRLSRRQRDYLLLTAFVLARHNCLDRALAVIDGLLALGESGGDIRLARVVLRFLLADFVGALADLDELESTERPGLDPAVGAEAIRLRRFVRARCYCETGRLSEGETIARTLLLGQGRR
jgi:hypothetical protein